MTKGVHFHAIAAMMLAMAACATTVQAAPVQGAPASVARVAESGSSQLADLTPERLATMTKVTLTGDVTELDFQIIRDKMPRLQKADLTAANLTELPARAFASKTLLMEVKLPEGLTAIGAEAFLSCRALTSLTIPAGVTTIGSMAFARSGLVRANLGNVTSLGTDALSGCHSLRTITVSEGNPAYTVVNGALFTADRTHMIKYPAAALGTVNFPEELTVIEPYACENATQLHVGNQLPASLQSIGDYAFANCPAIAGTFTIPASVKSIGKGAFYGCTGITGHVEVPEGTTVAPHTFSYMTGMTRITLPASLSALPSSLLENSTKIQQITSRPTVPPTVGQCALRGIDRVSTFIDVTTPAAYMAAPVWAEFQNYSNQTPEEPSVFAVNGDYRVVYVGPGEANGKYLMFNHEEYGAKVALTADRDAASVWELEFFPVTAAALSFKGENGCDFRFSYVDETKPGDSDRWCHVNKDANCYNDSKVGYSINNNRTVAFYMLTPEYTAAEGPVVAIVANATVWGVNDAGTLLTAKGRSSRLPIATDYLFRIEPKDSSVALPSLELTTTSQAEVTAIYDLNGRRVAAPARGVHIVVYSDGSVSKAVY